MRVTLGLALAWTRGQSLRIVELIWPAEATNAAYGRPALFECQKTAVGAAATIA